MDPENIEDKTWFAADDELRVPDDFDQVWDTVSWSTETYISSGQIRLAVEDPDVTVCDIEASNESPVIHLRINDDASEYDWP